MVLDTLHKMEWIDVEAMLATEAGQKMAMVYVGEDLPLHMALERKAPESTILSLLRTYPDAAARVGRLGGTPLHLAAQNSFCLSIIVALIRACPDVLDQHDDNGRLACDFVQRNELCREALLRPTACWIEDVEKGEYYDKVQTRMAQLGQKIQLLNDGIALSRKRRESLQDYIQQLEPRLQSQRKVLEELISLEKRTSDMYDESQGSIEEMRERIRVLSDEVAKEPDDEDAMLRSFMKRSYMERVQRQYEKVLARTDQIRKSLHQVSALAVRERGSDSSQS